MYNKGNANVEKEITICYNISTALREIIKNLQSCLIRVSRKSRIRSDVLTSADNQLITICYQNTFDKCCIMGNIS